MIRVETGHNSGAGQIRAFIDRVLRLKEEQDALSADIREVYAEANGEGFDKTALGNVVAHLRKVDKKGADAVNEAETIFDLYLTAYQGGDEQPSHAHAYAREEESQAKASEDNGATGETEKVAADSVAGDASRPVSGRADTATSDDGRDSPERRATIPNEEPFEPPAFLRQDTLPVDDRGIPDPGPIPDFLDRRATS